MLNGQDARDEAMIMVDDLWDFLCSLENLNSEDVRKTVESASRAALEAAITGLMLQLGIPEKSHREAWDRIGDGSAASDVVEEFAPEESGA